MPTSSTALTKLAHALTKLDRTNVAQNLITTLDHRAPSCAIWCAIEPYQNYIKSYHHSHPPSRVQYNYAHQIPNKMPIPSVFNLDKNHLI